MTQQEIRYLLQIMANADIKGTQSVFHANLMSKLALMTKKPDKKPDNKPDGD